VWRKPVTLEELAMMKDDQIMATINEFLIPPNRANAPVNPTDLFAAQFYMAELDRRNARLIEQRRQEAEGERDRIETKRHRINLGIEIAVLILIGLELIFAAVEGHEEYAILDNLGQSAAATASTLTSLQASIELNRAGVPSTSQSLPVVLDVAYSPMERRIVVTNLGKSGISLLGYQFDGRRGPKFNPPDLLPAGEVFNNSNGQRYGSRLF